MEQMIICDRRVTKQRWDFYENAGSGNTPSTILLEYVHLQRCSTLLNNEVETIVSSKYITDSLYNHGGYPQRPTSL